MKELNHLRKQIYRFFVCFKGITLNQYPISKGLFSLSVGSPCKQNNPPRHPFEARARAPRPRRGYSRVGQLLGGDDAQGLEALTGGPPDKHGDAPKNDRNGVEGRKKGNKRCCLLS